MTGSGARWSVSCWISSRVGACALRFPAEERVCRVLAEVPVQPHVSEQPVLRVGVPFEGQAEFVPDPAVRTIAADHVVGRDRVSLARMAVDGRANGIAGGGQAGELGSRLDHAAQLDDPGAQQPFSFVLREVEQEAEPRAVAREVEVGQAPATGVEAEMAHDLAAFGAALRQAHHVEDL